MTTNSHPVAVWATSSELQPIHVDCATAVMLKILDGKCKMRPEEKEVMAILYDAVKHQPGKLLCNDIHRLIQSARNDMNSELVLKIYEQRLYAETMIGRLCMKSFKAMLREQGIIGNNT